MTKTLRRRGTTSSPAPKQRKRSRTRITRYVESPTEVHKEVGGEMNLLSALALVMGTVIGAGIFAFIGNIRLASGSAAVSSFVWLSTGLYVLLLALCYVELNSVCKDMQGAEHSFLMEAFAPLGNFFGEFPAFSFFWTSLLVLRPISLAIQLKTYSEYVLKPAITNCDSCSRFNVSILSALVLTALVLINCSSTSHEMAAQCLTAAIKVVTCVVIIWGSLLNVQEKEDELLSINEPIRWSSLPLAWHYTMLAFDGWNSLSYCSKSLSSPTRSQMVSVLLGIPSATMIYVLLTASLLATVPLTIIMTSPAPFLSWAKLTNSALYYPVAIGVSISVLGAVNGTFFTWRRLFEAGTKSGHAPAFFNACLTGTGAPPLPLALLVIIAEFYLIVCDTEVLVKCFSVITGAFQGAALIALLVLRRSKPEVERPVRLPVIIPQILLVLMTIITVFSAMSFDRGILSSIIVFISILCSVYAICVYSMRRFLGP